MPKSGGTYYNARLKSAVTTENPGAEDVELFHVTASITSAVAATAVELLPAERVGPGRKAYLQGFVGKVDGATEWATTATVKVQDTAEVDFVTAAVAALTANARIVPGTSNVTLEDAYAEGTGGTAGEGLQLVGDANGTGSTLHVTVWGIIKPE